MDADKNPYGDEAMAACITSARGQSLEQSVAGLLTAVEEWCRPNGPLDDISILGVEWRP